MNTETQGDVITTPETAPVTEAVTEAETDVLLSDHDRLMASLAYNEEEQKILAETARKMSGLRVTYYADSAATQVVRSEVVAKADLAVEADRKSVV